MMISHVEAWIVKLQDIGHVLKSSYFTISYETRLGRDERGGETAVGEVMDSSVTPNSQSDRSSLLDNDHSQKTIRICNMLSWLKKH